MENISKKKETCWVTRHKNKKGCRTLFSTPRQVEVGKGLDTLGDNGSEPRKRCNSWELRKKEVFKEEKQEREWLLRTGGG